VKSWADTQTAWREFASDLQQASQVLRRVPVLPLVSVSLALTAVGAQHLQSTEPGAAIYVSVILLAAIGWVGTERIWFFRALRGKSLSLDEALSFTFRFWARYLSLAIILILTLSIAQMLIYLGLGNNTDARPLAQAALIVLANMAITFVTPALALTTRRTSEAIGLGFGMLIREWRQAKWYVVIPPLTATAALQIGQESSALLATMSLTGLGTLLNLWFKGATVGFYVRRHDVSDDGAARSGRQMELRLRNSPES